VLELDLWADKFLFSLDGIWIHIIDILQHKSLSLMSSALDHSATAANMLKFSDEPVDQTNEYNNGIDCLSVKNKALTIIKEKDVSE
jgi:hypothetical protein